jgi:hypothetical protein
LFWKFFPQIFLISLIRICLITSKSFIVSNGTNSSAYTNVRDSGVWISFYLWYLQIHIKLQFLHPRASIILGLFMKFTAGKVTHSILGQNEGLYEVCKFVEVFNHSKSSSEYQYVYNFSKLYVLLSSKETF